MSLYKIRSFDTLAAFFYHKSIIRPALRLVMIALISTVCLTGLAPGAQAALGACPVPPFAGNIMSPNVLLVFDTSWSMRNDDGDGVTRWAEARDAMLDFLAANKNIRFGLMRIDGTTWDMGARRGGVVGKHNAIKGGRLLVPTGYTGGFATSADYIIDYLNSHMSGTHNDWYEDTGALHWTNLAETLVDAGRYFATGVDGVGNREGKGPAGFGYYKEGTDYTFYYNAADMNPYLASITDDHGNAIDPTSPLQHSCEQAFVLMFTDGQSNSDNDWDLITDLIGDYDGDGDPRDCKRADPLEIRPDILDPGDPQYGVPLPAASYSCDTRADNVLGDPNENGWVNYLDDVAKYLFDNDMRSDIPGKQNVLTYTIAFYVADQTLLEDTAANGGGQHFTANSISELSEALQTAIEDILLKVASGTAVSTIATASHSDDYLVRAKFFPGASWKGYLERHNLSNPDFTTPDWEAASLLNARVAASGHIDREIYTFMSSQNPHKQEFTSSDGAVKTGMMDAWGLTGNPGEATDIINYIRGETTYDGDKYKDRNGWLLGDIIYSTPTAVGGPTGWYLDRWGVDDPPEYDVYQAFKNTHSNRKTMIYVGANDGMLHAFDAADGHEDWAFIPENIQTQLKELTVADCHKYFVDLTTYVTDAWDETEGGGGAWKSILIGGNRLGGQEYFALDITDPSADGFKAMWDQIPFGGQDMLSSTVPVIGKVQADNKTVDHWVAVITSGYHASGNNGRIAALKISDGSKVDIWDASGAYVNEMETQAKEDRIAGSPYYTMSSPAALDTDLDGYLDVIYAGDSEGTLWKFYYDYEDDTWKRFEMFNTGGRAISARPALAFDADRKLRIYFGTGKYLEESDKTNATQNAFYCLVDEQETSDSEGLNKNHYTRTVNLTGQLINISDYETVTKYDTNLISAEKDVVQSKGWYFLLDPVGATPAERILGKALVFAGTVFVTSFQPNDDICGSGGDARLYAFDYITAVIDAHGDEVLINYATGERYADIGQGVPSKPVYYFNPFTKKFSVIIQKSDSEVVKQDPTLKERPLAIKSWKAR